MIDTTTFQRLCRPIAAAAVLFATCGSASAAELRFAHIYSPEHSNHKAALRLTEVAKEQSNGSLNVRVLPSAQLGHERQIMEGLMVGTIDMGNITGNVLQSVVPLAGLTALPYLIRDFDHAFKVEDGKIGDEISKRILEKSGLRVIGYTTAGFRVVATPSKPKQTLKDFKGLKIRVPESPVMVATFKALGANPTPTPWGELYTALQTGVVEAGEAPPAALNDIKIFEIAKVISETNHVYTGQFNLINEKVFQKLSDAEKKATLAAGRAATELQRSLAQKNQKGTIEMVQKTQGVKVYPVDTKPFQEAVRPVYENYAKTIGGMDMVNAVLNTK